MRRKKVKTETIKETTPKKRSDSNEKKSPITSLPNNYKVRWDKIKGVEGKIVRYRDDESDKRKEELHKKNYRQLYVGIDGNHLYFYYELL
jgi:hypothetical protein